MPDPVADVRLPAVSAADALARAADGAVLVDVRKTAAKAASGRTVAGAALRDPYVLGHDDALTTADRPIVAFCVHGHEVSQFACALLRLHGREAAYVTGGFEALAAAGALLEDLPR